MKEVLDILRCLKVDKSPSPDQIYPGMLWESREENDEIDGGKVVDIVYMDQQDL